MEYERYSFEGPCTCISYNDGIKVTEIHISHFKDKLLISWLPI